MRELLLCYSKNCALIVFYDDVITVLVDRCRKCAVKQSVSSFWMTQHLKNRISYEEIISKQTAEDNNHETADDGEISVDTKR